ncbi:MAG TPA: hypothetical protein VMZ04_07345 [Anaerolineae bacterium]|nr:hypothetical protein [Anaerolineae bacterium]
MLLATLLRELLLQIPDRFDVSPVKMPPPHPGCDALYSGRKFYQKWGSACFGGALLSPFYGSARRTRPVIIRNSATSTRPVDFSYASKAARVTTGIFDGFAVEDVLKGIPHKDRSACLPWTN